MSGMGFTRDQQILRPKSRRFGMTQESGTAVNVYGDGANVAGTVTRVVGGELSPPMIDYATPAVLNSTAGQRGNPVWYAGNSGDPTNLYCQIWANLVQATVERVWIGLTVNTLGVQLASDDPAGNFVGFRYNPATSPRWDCVSKDGAVIGVTDSGVTVASAFPYLFEIEFFDRAAAVRYRISQYIQGGVEVAAEVIRTARLPVVGSALNNLLAVQTLEAVIKNIRGSWVYTESDR